MLPHRLIMQHSKHPLLLACASLLGVGASLRATPVAADAGRREQLRTGQAETAEPHTDEPLKAVLQNLFLQEDVFPQPHLATQLGARAAVLREEGEAAVEASGLFELGLGDSWTLSLGAPVSLLPSDERGLGNVELGLLYSFWVSRNEDVRLTATVGHVLPTRSPAGDNALSHSASFIGYVRLSPLHLQAVASVDVSHGELLPAGPRVRPAGAAAAILKLDSFGATLELAAQQNFREPQYLGALGLFWYPGAFEIGIAARLDFTETPVTLGGLALVSYGFDAP